MISYETEKWPHWNASEGINSNPNKCYINPSQRFLETALYQMPIAYAELLGNPGTGEINGMVRFYSVGKDVLVNAEVYGLPFSTETCNKDIFGFHIHEGNSCSGMKKTLMQMPYNILILTFANIQHMLEICLLSLELMVLLG